MKRDYDDEVRWLFNSGQHAAARELAEEWLDEALGAGDKSGEGNAKTWLSVLTRGTGDHAAADRMLHEGLDAALEGSDELRHCREQLAKATAELGRSNPRGAAAAAEKGLQAAQHAGNKAHQSWALRILAESRWKQGRFEEALSAAAMAVDLARESGDRPTAASALAVMSEIETKIELLRSADPPLAWLLEARREELRPSYVTDILPERRWLEKVDRMLESKAKLEDDIKATLSHPPVPTDLPAGAVGGLWVLRKWASYGAVDLLRSCAPGHGEASPSVGGGYFVRIGELGIVIDPGLGFGRAFRDATFVPRNIDVVLATHHHIDHTGDMLPIATCLFEMGEAGVDHHVSLHLAPGPFKPLTDFLPMAKALSPGQSQLLEGGADEHVVRVTALPADHKDLTNVESPAIGLRIDVERASGGPSVFSMAVTGDTRYGPEYAKVAVPLLADCHLVVVHVGSVYKDDKYNVGGLGEGEASSGVGPAPYHLGLSGTMRLLAAVKQASEAWWNPLVLLSEWGEELASYRTDICEEVSRMCDIGRVWPAEMHERVAFFSGMAVPLCHHCANTVATHWHTDEKGDITYECDDHVHR